MPAADDSSELPAEGGGAPSVEDADALVAAFARELERLAPDAERLVVALSGGADSMAALRLALAAGRRPLAAHFDHNLRPGSADDAAFVRESCAALGVELLEGSADVAAVARERGWNLEDAARRLRYDFLYRALGTLGGRGAIVVAHTLDDQAETLLLQLLRGAAFTGGMRARNRAVVRPLLGVHRDELRRYLRHLGQAWREDASNLDVGRSRAWVRHELLPLIERRYPGVARRLAGTAQQQREARAALEALAARRFPEPRVRVTALRSAPAALRKAALAARLRAAGSRPSRQLIDELDAAITRAAPHPAEEPPGGVGPDGGAAPWRHQLPNGAEARMAYGELEIVAPGATGVAPEPVPVRHAEQLPPGVDPALLATHPGLELRARRPGDRIRLAGGTKLVSDLLVDRKVPRAERERLRLLADGSEVLWVEGVAAVPGALLEGGERMLGDDDRRFMLRALEQAGRAAELGEVPIGAVVVRGGEVLAAAHNLTESSGDPTAHAEVVAIRRAAEALGDWRLAGATLYVTLEPCPMCFGAVLQTQLARVVFGADNLRDGALGGVTDLRGEGWKRLPEVRGGVEAARAARLLREGFAARRKRR